MRAYSFEAGGGWPAPPGFQPTPKGRLRDSWLPLVWLALSCALSFAFAAAPAVSSSTLFSSCFSARSFFPPSSLVYVLPVATI